MGEREGTTRDDSLGRVINCQRRTAGKRSDASTLLVSNRQRVSTRGIERTGLTTEQRVSAEEAYRKELERSGRSAEGGKVQYPDWAYRNERARPLLMIHLIEVQSNGLDVLPGQPVAAWGISFPRTDRKERRVEYVVNTMWLRENFGDDVDEDEMEGDDG